MAYLRRAFEVPHGILPRDGYWFFLRDELDLVPHPWGGWFLVEYDIKLKLQPESARKLGREFSEPLKLTPKLDKKAGEGRWDLRVNFSTGSSGVQHRRYYHNVLGLLRTKTKFGRTGRRLHRPGYVSHLHFKDYQVDHKDWNNLDCRLRNLRAVPGH